MTEADDKGLSAAIERARPVDLKLDLANPRMAELEFNDETAVLEHLLEQYDVEELVLSILTAGWLDYDPLIVENGTNVVLEGNRRLAALRLIGNQAYRESVGYNLPDIGQIHPNSNPQLISVRYVSHRSDAYVFIGFKHINGPFKWDALAKAKFAANWVSSGHDIEVVSRTLGDTHSTVLRLINGWNVLQRAIADGFDTGDVTTTAPLPISHLYTALTRPDIRRYLGIEVGAKKIISQNDIPATHSDKLLQLMSWLYGRRSRKEPHVVKSQNPDLGLLVRVIAHDASREELVANRDLEAAAEHLTPAHERFETALRHAARACEDTLGLVKDYDGSPTLIELVNSMGKTILRLRSAMQSTNTDPLAEFADASPKA